MSNLTFVNQVGAPDGINQAGPGTFIPDTFVRWAQDVLFDRAGLLRRRAPFKNFTYANFVQPSTNNERVVSFVSTLNPVGERILGLVVSTSTASRILFYDSNYTPTGTSTLDATLAQDSIFDCKQASNGGMWLSFLDSYAGSSSSNKYHQYFWFGGNGVEHTNASTVSFGTLGTGNAATYTNIITGTFDTSKLTKGMFVYVTYGGSDYYIGTIADYEVSQITLAKDIIRFVYNTALAAGTTTGLTIKFKNVRPYIHSHGRGLITRGSTTSTVITSGSVGTEGEGHFAAADLDKSPYWAIYRASDGEWIGDIDSTGITNDTVNLTIRHTDQANTALTAEEYLAYAYTPVPSPIIMSSNSNTFAGIFNATYAGYQWFGNAGNTQDRNRVVFSAYHDSEAVDLSADGADSVVIPGTSEMRGMANSSSGLLIFMTDKTYIIRGNYRSNFSLELLYPEGCLSSMSIVEYGGGVFWASKLGIMFYDGASVRNLTESNLGVYYTDGVKNFSLTTDRVYSFLHKDYLFINFSNFNSLFKPLRYEPVYAESISSTPAISGFAAEDWDPDFTPDDFDPANNVPIYWEPITMYQTVGSGATGKSFVWNSGVKWQSSTDKTYVWGPADFIEGITFAIYIPTNAITVVSNFDQRGAVKIDGINGIRALMASNVISGSYVQARIIDVDSILNVDASYDSPLDDELIENVGKADANYIKGPDFYLQTKHFSVGDPILRKWFRQVFLDLYLIDGAVRMDIVDNEDNDRIDVQKKAHKNWEIFGEETYSWDELESIVLPKRLSPNRSTWLNLSNLGVSWYNLADAAFERRKKRLSWRYPTFGIRLYQMNKYRPRNYQTSQRPHTLMMDSLSIGFKPMRQSRQ